MTSGVALRLGSELLRIAHAGKRGVPLAGREAECTSLRAAGRLDPSLGRIYEGHVNAAQLVARCGTPAQRAALARDIDASLVFGVWNTQEADGVTIRAQGDGYVLAGAKTWASGAGSLDRALVTAAWPDGSLQMCFVPLDRVSVAVDASAWRPLGMERSNSFRVDFSGSVLNAGDLIGKPGDYARAPWFFGGAWRFLAVQTGIVERLAHETAAYLLERERDGDPLQQVRVAHMRTATHTCLHWLRACAATWQDFDADESEANAELVAGTVDMARAVVERCALDAIEAAVQSVGARGLLEPLPFAQLVRDLQMYLRQPAPDAAMLRVAASAFREAAAARKADSASSTGTSA